MGRKSKKDLIETTPTKLLRRSDAIQYWLQQQDYPKNYRVDPRFTILDKMILSMIEKVLDDAHPAAATWLFENGWGKNTEGADVSKQENNAGARFNIPMTVSELKKKQTRNDEKGQSSVSPQEEE